MCTRWVYLTWRPPTPKGATVMAAKSKLAKRKGRGGIERITTCLAFKDRAEEAVRFYVSVFPNSKIVGLTRSEGDGPIPKGKLMGAEFRLLGREFTAFDGGPAFSFSIGMSLMGTCRTQAEIDRLWETLSRGGGKGPGGRLPGKFGGSGQVLPPAPGKNLFPPGHRELEGGQGG